MSRVSKTSESGVDERQAGSRAGNQEDEKQTERRRRVRQRWSAYRRHRRSLLGARWARKTNPNPSASTPSATSTKLTCDAPDGSSAMAARTMIHPPASNKKPVTFMKNLVHYSSARLARGWRVR